jgi:hypothetical protein
MAQTINFPSLFATCGLTSEQLMVLNNNGAGKNPNIFAGYLFILTKGWNALGAEFEFAPEYIPYVVSKETYKDFINKDNGVLKNCGLLEIAKARCPAGSSGQLNDLGRLGMFSRLTGFQITNPISGPATHLPPGCKDILDQTDNEFVKGLTDVCESICSHSYLKCISVGSYGGFQQAIHYITGVVQDFFSMMYDVYQGLQLLALQAQLFINEIIEDIQTFLVDRFLSKRVQIFLAVVCVLLAAVQTLLDDIGFFASLFKGSDSLFNALNVVQTVVNLGAQAINYVYNPITGALAAAFPKQAQGVLNFITKIGQLPEQFLGHALKSFSLGKGMHNNGIAIANAIIKRYGLGAQLGDLAPILESFGTAVPQSNWHRTAAPVLKGPMSFLPRNIRNCRAALDHRFSSLTYDTNGVPHLTFSGLKNSFTNVVSLEKNPYYQKLKQDGGLLAADANGLINTLRYSFGDQTFNRATL